MNFQVMCEISAAVLCRLHPAAELDSTLRFADSDLSVFESHTGLVALDADDTVQGGLGFVDGTWGEARSIKTEIPHKQMEIHFV